MNPNKLSRSFKLFYESPINVPAPYHLEAVFSFLQFDTDKPSVAIEIQYIDRSDFSREELIADGLVPDDSWTYEGELPLVWRDRLMSAFQEYVTGSCSLKTRSLLLHWKRMTQHPTCPCF